ncbi:FAD-binding oxidoreductase [Propionibacteriaceae bacterium Y2011]|uniref:FAD-binding oxidoreductase n=1 Tax=Microlunatus sp. Y2014 TaxID=3418488 RepID=UPI003B49481F
MAETYVLEVAEVRPLTDESYLITFAVPDELAESYAFRAGQHLTVQTRDDGVVTRRAYSLCAAPHEGRLSIGVKVLEGGGFSTRVRDRLAVGDRLEVMTPNGRFVARDPDAEHQAYGAVAAGSGITPIRSIVADLLHRTETSTVDLVYGNRGPASVMFADELAELAASSGGRLRVRHVHSREPGPDGSAPARLTGAVLTAELDRQRAAGVTEWFLCGPEPMTAAARAHLLAAGVHRRLVHTELFWTG